MKDKERSWKTCLGSDEVDGRNRKRKLTDVALDSA